MDILIDNYKLMPCATTRIKWDLEEYVLNDQKNNKTKNTHRWMNIGYGMSIEQCIKHMIAMNVEKEKDSTSLSIFLNTYTEESERMMETFKQIAKDIKEGEKRKTPYDSRSTKIIDN